MLDEVYNTKLSDMEQLHALVCRLHVTCILDMQIVVMLTLKWLLHSAIRVYSLQKVVIILRIDNVTRC